MSILGELDANAWATYLKPICDLIWGENHTAAESFLPFTMRNLADAFDYEIVKLGLEQKWDYPNIQKARENMLSGIIFLRGVGKYAFEVFGPRMFSGQDVAARELAIKLQNTLNNGCPPAFIDSVLFASFQKFPGHMQAALTRTIRKHHAANASTISPAQEKQRRTRPQVELSKRIRKMDEKLNEDVISQKEGSQIVIRNRIDRFMESLTASNPSLPPAFRKILEEKLDNVGIMALLQQPFSSYCFSALAVYRRERSNTPDGAPEAQLQALAALEHEWHGQEKPEREPAEKSPSPSSQSFDSPRT